MKGRRILVAVAFLCACCAARAEIGRLVTDLSGGEWTLDGMPVVVPDAWNKIDGADGCPGENAKPRTSSVAAACPFIDSAPRIALNALQPQMGFNVYPNWYGGKSMRGWVDAFLKDNNRPYMALSEYGAGGSVRQHENPPKFYGSRSSIHNDDRTAYAAACARDGWEMPYEKREVDNRLNEVFHAKFVQ